MIKLRKDYQLPVKNAITAAWERVRAVLAVMATGAGKTVVFSSVIHDHKGASAAVVHRKEIVVQISCSLARLGVKHRIVAPPATVRLARRKHLNEFGKSFVDPSALCGVASVQTLTSKSSATNATLQGWLKQVTLCVFDEGHHYVKTGLWARAVEVMQNAKLLQVTACPERADGKGLGVEADGFAEEMVEGPQVKWLIEQGYLSPFKYYAPSTDFDVAGIAVTASGDFNSRAFRARVVDSHLVGDVVKQYLQFAKGKRAIVFATDVETAYEMQERFKANGVRALALHGDTEDAIRDKANADFEHGTLDVLVNVDLFDEGYDVPAAECAIIARPTQSLNKFLQMCGRVLRVLYGKGYDLETKEGRRAAIANGDKPHAIIIDPVRNWERHGMPDWPRVWSLLGKEKGTRGTSDTIPQRVCLGCAQPYEAFFKVCPYCGLEHVPAGRSLPEQVDGDLFELNTEAMAAMFEKMRKAELSDEEFKLDLFARNVPQIGHSQQLKAHNEAKYRREVLRQLVGWWVGMQQGREMSEIHRRFYHRFGVDIGSAFTLDAKQTDALADKVAACFTLDAVLT